jgi:S-adenosylmethionine decarboxylase
VNGGVEWIVDAHGCDPDRLRDRETVRGLLDRVVAELDLRVVGDRHVHAFGGPGGVTALYLLTESHLCAHTYPESGVATFNLYCCRERPAWPWQQALTEILGARHVEIRQVPRGGER